MPASIQDHRKVSRVLRAENQSKLPTKLEIIERPPGNFFWRGNDGFKWSANKPTLGAAINELASGRIVNNGHA